MSNDPRKELGDEQYHSQPIQKSKGWVPMKWRRLSLKHASSSSSSAEPAVEVEETVNEEDKQPNRDNPHAEEAQGDHNKTTFLVVPDFVSNNWSENAVEFYLNGDASYCYSTLFEVKLTKSFWGTLLGYEDDGRLWKMHITGWVNRMMRTRLDKLARYGPTGLDCTILPATFRDELCVNEYKKPTKYADGTHELYPPFWQVRYVYVPLHIKPIEDWILARIDLHTMEMVQYWSNIIYRDQYNELVYNKVVSVFPFWFDNLLHQIRYWKKVQCEPHTHVTKRELTHVFSEEYLPQDGGDLGGDSGVLVCRLMQKLVKGKTLSIGEDFKESCVKYRRYMAKEFYQYRYEK